MLRPRPLVGLRRALAVTLAPLFVSAIACSSTPSADAPSGAGGTNDGGAPGTFGDPPGLGGDGGAPSTPGSTESPKDCTAAALAKSYVGCEFWPTVVSNPVYSVFDFAAVVANASDGAATITVERGGAKVATVTIAPGAVEPVYLPWIPELKGPDFDGCTQGSRPTASVRVDRGAYKLTSSVPVTVWQFNPLEYKAGSGGAPGKSWACPYPPALCNGNGVDCLSVSNDASLLLPTAAMTGNYRLFGMSGASLPDAPGSYAITATQDGTNVSVSVSAKGHIAAGTGVTETLGGGRLTLSMNAGDVVELLGQPGKFWGDAHADLSGSVVAADKPVQVISLVSITAMPSPETAGEGYADHLEETLLPAETMGSHYVVAPPTTPQGSSVGHYLRFFGNRDGTTITYPSGKAPAGAPTTLNAGDVVDLKVAVTDAFEAQGSHEFAIASFMRGGVVQDPPSGTRGDPSMTFLVASQQFRAKYSFLAPTDYDVSYADIVVPAGADVKLDGAPLTGTKTPIGSSTWSLVREPVKATGAASKGAHTLTASAPVGLQIMGFGHATSYYTPGGANLVAIAPPPVIPK